MNYLILWAWSPALRLNHWDNLKKMIQEKENLDIMTFITRNRWIDRKIMLWNSCLRYFCNKGNLSYHWNITDNLQNNVAPIPITVHNKIWHISPLFSKHCHSLLLSFSSEFHPPCWCELWPLIHYCSRLSRNGRTTSHLHITTLWPGSVIIADCHSFGHECVPISDLHTTQ